MGVVRREGKWSLEKERDGVYAINERGELRARILTADYESQGMMDNVEMDMVTEQIEVRNFSEAKHEFEAYIERAKRGGFGLF